MDNLSKILWDGNYDPLFMHEESEAQRGLTATQVEDQD